MNQTRAPASITWEKQRSAMIEEQLRRRGIRDQRVLEAMRRIPRHEFVSETHRANSYADSPLPIGYGQTISQPYITALMAQCLELQGWEKVLDVGTGSGYHAAVLGELAARIFSIELIPELVDVARLNLARAQAGDNIALVAGDGSLGYAEQSPYDAISVAAAAPEVPAALLDQLNDPGILVIPVGTRLDQELRVVKKSHGAFTARTASLCRFVPLIGEEGWPRETP